MFHCIIPVHWVTYTVSLSGYICVIHVLTRFSKILAGQQEVAGLCCCSER